MRAEAKRARGNFTCAGEGAVRQGYTMANRRTGARSPRRRARAEGTRCGGFELFSCGPVSVLQRSASSRDGVSLGSFFSC